MNSSKPLVIYHKNCLDGFAAAYAAWLKFGDSAEYVAMDYSDRERFMEQFATDVVTDSGEIQAVYILDFSFSPSHLKYLTEFSSYLVWIDHHKTAFEEIGMANCITGGYMHEGAHSFTQLDSNNCGAILAWKYFHGLKPVPSMFHFIDDRDRWQWKLPGTREYCLALGQYPQDFKIWGALQQATDTLLDEGKVLVKYFDTQLERAVEATKEPCEILGAVGLCANLPPLFASEAGHLLAKESGTYGATWFKQADGSVKWSLRSVGDYDVSALCKQWNGGGHKNAAGFVLTEAADSTIQKGTKLWQS